MRGSTIEKVLRRISKRSSLGEALSSASAPAVLGYQDVNAVGQAFVSSNTRPATARLHVCSSLPPDPTLSIESLLRQMGNFFVLPDGRRKPVIYSKEENLAVNVKYDKLEVSCPR